MIIQNNWRMSLFFGEGGVVFCQFVTLYIRHTSPREGGVKGELANVTKYAGFF